jgi:hypothetical protein
MPNQDGSVSAKGRLEPGGSPPDSPAQGGVHRHGDAKSAQPFPSAKSPVSVPADFGPLINPATPTRAPLPPPASSWGLPTASSATEAVDGFQVVLLIHGIRTQADWGPMVQSKLEVPGRIEVIPIRYGYFDAFRFWFPFWTRITPVENVYVQIRVALQKYKRDQPDAKLSIVAHSFGTYVVGQILRRAFDLKIHRLILCGSVLPRDFPWHEYQGRFDEDKLVNECGKADIWPVLAQSTSWGYGASGTHGFGAVLVKDRHHEGGHGQYFDPKFVETYWEPFFRRGEYQRTDFEKRMPPTPWWISVLGILPLRWVVLVIILAVCFGLARLSLASWGSPLVLPPIAGEWHAPTPFGWSMTQIIGEGKWDPASGRLRGAYTLSDDHLQGGIITTGNGTYELIPLSDHKATLRTIVPDHNINHELHLEFQGDDVMYSTTDSMNGPVTSRFVRKNR